MKTLKYILYKFGFKTAFKKAVLKEILWAMSYSIIGYVFHYCHDLQPLKHSLYWIFFNFVYLIVVGDLLWDTIFSNAQNNFKTFKSIEKKREKKREELKQSLVEESQKLKNWKKYLRNGAALKQKKWQILCQKNPEQKCR